MSKSVLVMSFDVLYKLLENTSYSYIIQSICQIKHKFIIAITKIKPILHTKKWNVNSQNTVGINRQITHIFTLQVMLCTYHKLSTKTLSTLTLNDVGKKKEWTHSHPTQLQKQKRNRAQAFPLTLTAVSSNVEYAACQVEFKQISSLWRQLPCNLFIMSLHKSSYTNNLVFTQKMMLLQTCHHHHLLCHSQWGIR